MINRRIYKEVPSPSGIQSLSTETSFDGLHRKLFVNLRNAKPFIGQIQPRHVFIGAEQDNPAIGARYALALKTSCP